MRHLLILLLLLLLNSTAGVLGLWGLWIIRDEGISLLSVPSFLVIVALNLVCAVRWAVLVSRHFRERHSVKAAAILLLLLLLLLAGCDSPEIEKGVIGQTFKAGAVEECDGFGWVIGPLGCVVDGNIEFLGEPPQMEYMVIRTVFPPLKPFNNELAQRLGSCDGVDSSRLAEDGRLYLTKSPFWAWEDVWSGPDFPASYDPDAPDPRVVRNVLDKWVTENYPGRGTKIISGGTFKQTTKDERKP